MISKGSYRVLSDGSMQIMELISSLVHYVYKLQQCCFPVSNSFEADDGNKKHNLGPIVMENVAQ